jgi:Rrf2 family protein
MRMSEGVEWAVHSCLILAWVEDRGPVPTARLASRYDLPPAYLNKQLQALGRAGVVTSIPGPKGGFRLARRPERITLMDIVAAIEGPDDAFRCTEIRQRGSAGDITMRQLLRPCSIATAMRTAELAWRRALAAQTLADMMAETERQLPQAADRVRRWYDQS